MSEYHVGAGLAGIYAGIFKKPGEWKEKDCVTDEAIAAVAQYCAPAKGSGLIFSRTWQNGLKLEVSWER